MDLQKALNVPGGREAIIKLANAMLKKAGSNAVTQFNESVPILSQTTQEAVSGSGISGTAQQANQSVPSMVDQAPPASVYPPEQGGIVAEPTNQFNPGMEGVMAAQAFLAPIMEAAMNGDPNAMSIIAQTAGHIAQATTESAQNMAMQAAAPSDGSNLVGPDGMPMANAQPVDQGQGGPAPLPPVPQQNSGIMMDQNGQPVDQNGNPVQVDAQGNPMPQASPEKQVADQIVPDVGPQAPVGEESGKEPKKPGDKKKTEGVQTDSDRDAKKIASLNVNQLRGLLSLARMGKI